MSNLFQPFTLDEDAQLKAMFEQHFTDWSTPLSDPLKWYTEDVVVFDMIPPLSPHIGKAAFLQGATDGFYSKMESVKFSLKELIRLKHIGDVAWMEAIVHGVALPKDGGANLELDIRMTQIWVKHNGTWLIVHEHVSVPLEAPS
jgi:ketosteroid isomerase-like protein